jgi:CubicO group peptidase (beta-lactamase class C family)
VPRPTTTDATADGVPSDASVEPIPSPAPTDGVTTTTAAPAVDPWSVFDTQLASRLLDRGDYAVGVAVAVRGKIVHTADLGYRVAPVPQEPVDPNAVPPVDGSVPTGTPPTSEAATTEAATTTTTGPPVDGAPGTAIAPEDRFRIASISKVITAIVVLQFVEAGQLGLDDAVGGRLAQLVGADVSDPRVEGITVRQLLSHTAGFPSYQRAFFGGRYASCPELASYALSQPLSADPSTNYTYSNLNFCLLGLLVEQIAGRPYEAVVTDRLLAPLGIDSMRMAPTADTDPTSVIHPSVPGRNYMEALGAAGAWTATPSDLVKIFDSLDLGDRGFHPLSQATVDLMRTIVPTGAPPSADGRGYGLGMMIFGDGTFGHTGTIENTHAMVLDRPDGVTWSVLVSGEYPGTTGNLRQIFDAAARDAGVPLT